MKIVGVISRTRYLLRVAIRYNDRSARVVLVNSTGLDQSGDRIYRKAAAWIIKLHARVRAELLKMGIR